MKKCEHKGCEKLIDDKYRFCYEHRKDKYYDICRFHGRTLFQEGHCCQCNNLRRATYRVFKKK